MIIDWLPDALRGWELSRSKNQSRPPAWASSFGKILLVSLVYSGNFFSFENTTTRSCRLISRSEKWV